MKKIFDGKITVYVTNRDYARLKSHARRDARGNVSTIIRRAIAGYLAFMATTEQEELPLRPPAAPTKSQSLTTNTNA